MFEVSDLLFDLIEAVSANHVGIFPNFQFEPGALQISLRDVECIEETLGRCIGPLAEAGSMHPGKGKPLAVISALFRSSSALQTSHSSLKLSTLL